jgi:hypothetical protein
MKRGERVWSPETWEALLGPVPLSLQKRRLPAPGQILELIGAK